MTTVVLSWPLHFSSSSKLFVTIHFVFYLSQHTKITQAVEASNILFLLFGTCQRSNQDNKHRSCDWWAEEWWVQKQWCMHVPLFNYREFQCAQWSQMFSMKENNHWLQGSFNKVTTQDTALLSKCHQIKSHIYIFEMGKKKTFQTERSNFPHRFSFI